MRKILVISNLYPNDKTPYHGTFIKNFIDELEKYPTEKKVYVCLLKGQPVNFFLKLYKYIVFYILIVWNLLFCNYDLIYVHFITHAAIPIRFASYFRTLNIAFNIHGEDLLVVGRFAKFLLKIARPLLRNAQFIVVPSFFFKTVVMNRLSDIKPDDVIVSASSGVIPPFYQKKREYHCKIEEITVGYVSRIERDKGWDTFIKAIKILRDKNIKIKVLLVGGGSQVGLLNKQIEELGLSEIKRFGRQPYIDLPKIYAQIDLFVFPTRLVESLGLVGLEAMASSIPVIGARIGGLQDYVKDGVNGFFFTPGDEHDLANKIQDYINLSPVDRQSFMEAAHRTALYYQSDVVAKRLFDNVFKRMA